jgi:hypothetical protein
MALFIRRVETVVSLKQLAAEEASTATDISLGPDAPVFNIAGGSSTLLQQVRCTCCIAVHFCCTGHGLGYDNSSHALVACTCSRSKNCSRCLAQSCPIGLPAIMQHLCVHTSVHVRQTLNTAAARFYSWRVPVTAFIILRRCPCAQVRLCRRCSAQDVAHELLR